MIGNEINGDTINLSVAKYCVQLVTDDEDVASRLRKRYADFLGESGVLEATISLLIRPGSQFIDIKPGSWIIESAFSDAQLTYRSYLERGEINWQTREGWLEMAPNANVENFLRVIYAWLCLRDGGLLLHAAGLIRNGEGYVFFGPSGAGKTTTTQLSTNIAEVLSDDLVILRCENGSCHLYGVPFKGDYSNATRANQEAPLIRIFRLYQDSDHYLEELPASIATAELVASAPFVVRDITLSQQLLTVCRRIVESTPVQGLHFRCDNGFWKEIDGYFEHLS